MAHRRRRPDHGPPTSTALVERWEYFLDGDDLTLILTKESLLSLSRQVDDSDARKDAYEFYSGLLADDDLLRFFYKRKP